VAPRRRRVLSMSSPGLTRRSMMRFVVLGSLMDARVKPGHDAEGSGTSQLQELVDLADFHLLPLEIIGDTLVEPGSGGQHLVFGTVLADKR